MNNIIQYQSKSHESHLKYLHGKSIYLKYKNEVFNSDSKYIFSNLIPSIPIYI